MPHRITDRNSALMEKISAANLIVKHYMAQLNNTENSIQRKSAGVNKIKKRFTKVDMTPMVDLGFLLITFFIYTTTMSSPSVMNLVMPIDKDVNDSLYVKRSGAMTILIGKENQLYYYMGELQDESTNVLTADITSIRSKIANKKQEVIRNHIHDQSCIMINKNDKQSNACLDRDLMVIIKPGKEANYKSIIDLLDEMAINGVKRYALVDIEPDESEVFTTNQL